MIAIELKSDNEQEMAAASYFLNVVIMPFFESKEFDELKKLFRGTEWTNKLEKSKKPLKKTQAKKKSNSRSLKKPIKKETKSLKSAKKSSKESK